MCVYVCVLRCDVAIDPRQTCTPIHVMRYHAPPHTPFFSLSLLSLLILLWRWTHSNRSRLTRERPSSSFRYFLSRASLATHSPVVYLSSWLQSVTQTEDLDASISRLSHYNWSLEVNSALPQYNVSHARTSEGCRKRIRGQ